MGKKTHNLTTTEIIQLFQTAPEQAYRELIQSGHYFYSKHSHKFWTELESLTTNPIPCEVSRKLGDLKFFFDLNKEYKEEKEKRIAKLVEMNPNEVSFCKAMFLCLELGETSVKPTYFPSYTEQSSKAIKVLFSEILPKLKPKGQQSNYSRELVICSCGLIKIQADITSLDEFVDAYVWAGFELRSKEEGKGFSLGIPIPFSKHGNLFVLNKLKNAFKRDVESWASNPKISEETHFKIHDPTWKTNEGLANIMHGSGLVVKGRSKGLTSLQVDDGIMWGMGSDNPQERNRAWFEFEKIRQEQNFHYHLRRSISRIYHPNDEVGVHDLQLEIKPGVVVSLYELICAMSCLIAVADNFRVMGEFHKGSIKNIKTTLFDQIKHEQPKLSATEVNEQIDSMIVHSLRELETEHGVYAFHFLDLNSILHWLRKVEELKTKSNGELKAMISLLSSPDSPLPFNPLYLVGGKYYFSYVTCMKFDLNRALYDYYISDKLFSSTRKGKKEQQIIGETQKNREVLFTDSLKELFQQITPFVESSLEFENTKYDLGGLRGEFDLITYFEEENIIIPIEVKLSNVSPRSEKRKQEWITNRITKKGSRQIAKYVRLLQSKSGLKFVADQFRIGEGKEIAQPQIYPLLVSDNFFVDHLSYPYGENGKKFICVSYFELKHLILNEKIDSRQKSLPVLNNNAASQLIKTIKDNTFWSFLDELVEGFQYSKTLIAIIEKYRIEMKI